LFHSFDDCSPEADAIGAVDARVVTLVPPVSGMLTMEA